MEHAQILQLIHQTAPALVADGDQLTQHFYQHLFSQYPHLRESFNPANQAMGAQARSLFDAIVLFVTNYAELETLGDDAKRIAAKHVSLDVRPEDYALVGASLLATIQARLGDDATPEIMKAWELAYGRIAGILTGLEAAAYEQQRTQPGGWNGFRPFVVTGVVLESPNIHSFYLRPQDGAALPAYLPGQFISLAVDVPGHGYQQIRQYSLSDAPGKPYYRITVKRGVGASEVPAALVSNYLHDTVKTGSILRVHAPVGEFHLKPGATAPLVLLAGGLGITPFMAMLEQLATEESPRSVLLIHAVRSPEQHPFRARLRQLAQRPGFTMFTLYQGGQVEAVKTTVGQPAYTELPGLLTAEHLDYVLTTPGRAGADFYCCGPLSFMRHVYGLLAARGIDTCRFEEFGPTQLVAVPATSSVVEEPAPAPLTTAHCPHLNRSEQLQPSL